MNPQSSPGARHAIDTVEIARVERLVANASPEELTRLFSAREITDAGTGASRVASLAARLAAKEACCKLFPREIALGTLSPFDFAVERDGYGSPTINPSPNARAVLDRHRLSDIRISITHTESSASAMVWAEAIQTQVPWFGRWLYNLLPYRRSTVLANFQRVFGAALATDEVRKLAQAYYAHYARFLLEFIRLPFMSARKRKAWIRVENIESPMRAHQKGRGVLLLTGHFGNFEVATVAGIGQFPQYRGLLHFVRRPLKPSLLNYLVNYRFRRAGFGVLPKRGSLDTILDLLSKGAIIVCIFDQHAGKGDGIVVDFFGHPAGTFKSVALLALTTGAPVVPASSWREADGSHVLRFEDELPLLDSEDPEEAVRLNTRAYNAVLERILLRHPEQWIWMHRRWKI